MAVTDRLGIASRRWVTRARWACRWLTACACFGLAISCAGGTTVPPPVIMPLTLPDPATDPAALLGPEMRLRGEINFWLGTPYRRGGTNRRGIDCSGFVQQIYRSAFDIDLPRTSLEQTQAGRAVPAGELAPGDLLVFRIRDARSHVGIYLGRDDFVHASPRVGVTIASLREPHWQRAFRGARRLSHDG